MSIMIAVFFPQGSCGEPALELVNVVCKLEHAEYELM